VAFIITFVTAALVVVVTLRFLLLLLLFPAVGALFIINSHGI
jgi:hypothetical protein